MNDLIIFLRREIVGAWRYRWWAMGVAWSICVVGWLFVYSMQDVYEANAKFFVETRSRLDRVIGEVTTPDQVGDQVNLVKQAMLGRPVLEQVARETDLDLRASTAMGKNDLISSLQQKIVITGSPGMERAPRPTDGIYTIAFRDKDRAMSLAVVEALLNEFMVDVVRGRQDSSKETIEFLREEISKYSEQLKSREKALADFKQQNVGLLPSDSGGYFNRLQDELTNLSGLEVQLENALSRKATLEAQLRGENPFVDEPGTATGSSAGAARVAGNGPRTEFDTRIAELEAQLSELLLRFTDRHPDVISVQEQIDQLRSRRAARVEEMQQNGGTTTSAMANNPVHQQLQIALNEINVEVAGLRSQLSRDRARIADLRNKVDIIPAIEAQLTELTRDYDQVKSTYDELRTLLEQEVIASRKQEAAVVNFRLIDPPYVGNEPVSPIRSLFLFAVLVFALGTGGGIAWLLHMLNPVFHDVSNLRDITGLPVLGAVSMTWLDRHHAHRKVELSSFAVAGGMLVVTFVLALLAQEPGGLFIRQLVG